MYKFSQILYSTNRLPGTWYINCNVSLYVFVKQDGAMYKKVLLFLVK